MRGAPSGPDRREANSARGASFERRVERIRKLARLLDESFRLPGTRFRFGYDPLVGLIPGVGDVAAALVSFYVIYESRQLGLPRRVLLRMVANSTFDIAIGTVPIVGDLADFGFKANRRNLRLLERHLKRLEAKLPQIP